MSLLSGTAKYLGPAAEPRGPQAFVCKDTVISRLGGKPDPRTVAEVPSAVEVREMETDAPTGTALSLYVVATAPGTKAPNFADVSVVTDAVAVGRGSSAFTETAAAEQPVSMISRSAPGTAATSAFDLCPKSASLYESALSGEFSHY